MHFSDILLFCCTFLVNNSVIETLDLVEVHTPERSYIGTNRIAGRERRKIFAFTGIPYAKPPIGDLRFRDPEPPVMTSEKFNATKLPPTCIQWDHLLGGGITGEEDCLYLNIYTNRIPKPPLYPNTQPTVVFLHAGTWSSGIGANEIFNPDYLIEHDVTVVTVNFRLGPFGFLSTEDEEAHGNFGLYDQIRALEWLRNNVRYFGGMNDSITVMGSGAGGISSHLLTLSPRTRGNSYYADNNAILHKAISQSGTAYSPHAIVKNPNNMAILLGHAVGCQRNTSSILLQCLKSLTAADILNGVVKTYKWHDEPMTFGPVIDYKWRGKNAIIPDEPHHIVKRGRFLQIPWIVGSNQDDAAVKAQDILNDAMLVSQLNRNWDKYGQLLLHLDNSSCKDPLEVSRKIRDFYMKGKPFGSSTELQLSRMLTDRFFHYPTEQAANEHCNILRGQSTFCYKYILEFSGRKAFVDLMEGEARKSSLKSTLGLESHPRFKNMRNAHGLGVAFLDELLYLFPSSKLDFEYERSLLADEASKVSSYMITFWTNFIKGGDPTPEIKGFPEDFSPWSTWWEPYVRGTNYYMVMNPEMETTDKPFRDEYMKFWKDLPLFENIDRNIIRDEL